MNPVPPMPSRVRAAPSRSAERTSIRKSGVARVLKRPAVLSQPDRWHVPVAECPTRCRQRAGVTVPPMEDESNGGAEGSATEWRCPRVGIGSRHRANVRIHRPSCRPSCPASTVGPGCRRDDDRLDSRIVNIIPLPGAAGWLSRHYDDPAALVPGWWSRTAPS